MRWFFRAALVAASLAATSCGFPDYGFTSSSGAGGAGGAPSTTTTTSSSISSSSSDASSSSGTPGCMSNADCDASSGKGVCDLGAHACVECLPTDDGACALGFYCPVDTCVAGCANDADCDANVPPALTCDTATHECTGCAVVNGVDPCPLGQLCNQTTTKCEAGCNASHGCPMGLSCCGAPGSEQCANTQIDPANCGACDAACPPPGTHAQGSCAASTCTITGCDLGFGNCDGMANNGCEDDVTSDVDHCGSCTTPCALPNAQVTCTSSACVLLSCNMGFGDCNAMAPGCETPLTNAANCGGCGVTCTNTHGTNDCVNQVCAPTCAPDYESCDGVPNNGCETPTTTVANCGDCDVPCDFANASETCPGGACTFSMCDIGFGNCDGNLGNGCETDTTSSKTHCGNCTTVCPGSQVCVNSMCQATCPLGQGDCDLDTSNGCEVNTNTDGSHCGSCIGLCGPTQFCSTGSCASCSGALRDCDDDGANGCEIDTASNALHCGGCGTTCGSDATCGCASSACTGGTIYLSEDFSDNSRGWGLGTEWAIGPASVSSGHQQGFPDPGTDHSPSADNGVAGVAIGGNYTNPIHSAYYLTSPVVNLAVAVGSVQLTFWRWLNCDWDPFTTHTVEVFNGSSWVVVWTNATLGNTFVTDSAWTKQTIDVTAYKNANFRVRFGHKLGKQGNFLAWIMSGWNVDDLTLSSGGCQ